MILVPVIMSGGAGTRLWPVSREGYPKPFMKLADGQSLLMKTYQRAASVMSTDYLVTVTNRDYFFESKDNLAQVNAKVQSTFLLEPFGRNTAPAIALAALDILEKQGPEAILLVMSADHLIKDGQRFEDAVAAAATLASQGYLVTFGITPTAPETGFGYIECGEALGVGYSVARFVEKPAFEKAQQLLASGNHLWNAGIFCFQAGTFLSELEKTAPEIVTIAQACRAQLGEGAVTPMQDYSADIFAKFPDISIDYALLERSDKVAVIPCDFGWSDIGSWQAVSELTVADEALNRTVGQSVIVDSRNVYVQSNDRLVAAVGVQDLVIVDTPDALLVVHADKTQDVRKVVAQLKALGHDAFKLHRTVARPWGTYTILEESSRFKIKRIEVKPGASLSLQMHHHRSEHWIVVSGTAQVTNGDKTLLLGANESTYIPAGNRHRLENPGVLQLIMIEVQSGEYLGEDDIVRFQDNYGRC
ncbi:mannose-1-phosphate guanylyltransferase/mannose-6-phosphate isomerase [Aquirhabdus sp.]|uniref:mannose-1-phosphate guanylyltransferase/mannose-6-phosphate isomerase n=1 Tax=Aquirhabdus sp. TaxID=2824160 RepID=UPI00396CD5CF